MVRTATHPHPPARSPVLVSVIHVFVTVFVFVFIWWRAGITSCRRFSFAPIFCRQPNSDMTWSSVEGVFDIVYPQAAPADDHFLTLVETLTAVRAAMDTFGRAFGRYTLSFNHLSLLEAVV